LGKNEVYLTDDELAEVKAAANLKGQGDDDVASEATSDTMKRRYKRNTGRTKAKVYTLPKKLKR
jgi:hypothetical protein